MTKSMESILEMYNIETRGRRFECPFCSGGHGHMNAQIYANECAVDSFSCFKCHKGGDVYTFIQLMEGCNFPEAKKFLGEETSSEEIKQRIRMMNLTPRVLVKRFLERKSLSEREQKFLKKDLRSLSPEKRVEFNEIMGYPFFFFECEGIPSINMEFKAYREENMRVWEELKKFEDACSRKFQI